jgi:hypothetical protein
MHHLPFADAFLAGSLLSLLLPVGLLIAITIWYAFVVQRVPEDTSTSSVGRPADEAVEAAGTDTVGDVSPSGHPRHDETT